MPARHCNMSVTATWLCQTCLLTRGLPARCVSRPGAAAQLPVACRQRRNVIATAATATGPGGSAEEPMDMMASFQQELLRREASAAAAQERETAYQFDGEALLQMLLDRWERRLLFSYCVTKFNFCLFLVIAPYVLIRCTDMPTGLYQFVREQDCSFGIHHHCIRSPSVYHIVQV